MDISERQLSHRIYMQIRDQRANMPDAQLAAAPRIEGIAERFSAENGEFSRMNVRQRQEADLLFETASVFAEALVGINRSENDAVLRSMDPSEVREVHFQEEDRDAVSDGDSLPTLIENALEANELHRQVRLEADHDEVDVAASKDTATALRTAVEDRILDRLDELAAEANTPHRI